MFDILQIRKTSLDTLKSIICFTGKSPSSQPCFSVCNEYSIDPEDGT
jgi:hypothetical protein